MKTLIIFLVIAGILLVGWSFFLKGKSSNSGLSAVSSLPSATPTTTPTATDSMSPLASPSSLPATLPEKVAVTMQTDRGDIQLELYATVAPKTVLNFLTLAQKGFYDGIKFHRVVLDFVIQGGDPLSKTDDPRVGSGGPGYAFEDEINPKSVGVPEELIKQYEAQGYKYNYKLKSLPMIVGALAMANAGPNTNGSQFFIVTTKDQLFLNGKHTVFGRVLKGMDVVRKIQQGDVIKGVKFNLN